MNRGFHGPSPNEPAGSYFPPPYSVPASTTAIGDLALPPAARSIPTVLGLLNALKRRWVLASFLGLLAALAAAAGFWLAAPTGKHQVKAIVEILPLRSSFDQRANDNDAGFEAFKENQTVLIKTRTLLTKIVQDPGVAVLPLIANSEDPVKTVEDYVGTKWVGPSLMAILMNGDQPEQLQKIMEVLVKKYIEQSKLDLQEQREQQKKQIQKALDDWIKRYENQRAFIEQMNRQGLSGNNAGANDMMLLRLDEKISETDKDVQNLTKILARLDTRIKNAAKQLEDRDSIKPPEAVLNAALDQDEGVRPAKTELDLIEQNYQETLKTAPDPTKSPAVDRARQMVLDAQERYDVARKTRRAALEKTMSIGAQAELERNLMHDRDEHAIASEDLLKSKKQLEDYETKRRNYNKLDNIRFGETDIAATKERLNTLRQQLDNIEILMSGESRIKEQEKPIVIPNPNIKQKMMFGVAIALIAFVLVLVIVAYLEWRSRRVDNVDQVINELNMRILGTIPAFPSRASLKAGEADMNQNWRFILNESVNSARTMLLHSAKTQQMQVLMVTSAMQGEGKTSLASQLATSMATAGLRTLILDLDLRNPSMNRLFDLPLTPGASEVLLQEIDVSDAVQPTTVPNLWVIPAGQCSNRVIASLAQGHPVETLFNRLRGQFDFIVVDTCPVLPVADALLIGQYVDGVVFSILQDISQLPKVLNASERLSQLNIPLLGAVVNGIKTDVHAYGYNYVKQLPA